MFVMYYSFEKEMTFVNRNIVIKLNLENEKTVEHISKVQDKI